MTKPAELLADVGLLGELLDETIREQSGQDFMSLVERLRAAAFDLRAGRLPGGRDAFASRFAELGTDIIERVAQTFTIHFHLINAAEEQHRIRILRRRDRPQTPEEGSIVAACRDLRGAGMSVDAVRTLLGRLLVMPVLTAHPTEARRRTVLDHLADIAAALDHLDDPRLGFRERARTRALLRERILALYVTEEARASRPTPLDEVRAGLHVFERTLLRATPLVYRELEEALALAWPGESLQVGPFLRWGTWIGGDRDGNPQVTAEVTSKALEQQRLVALNQYLADVHDLGRALSSSARRLAEDGGRGGLDASLAADRARFPEVAAARRPGLEPWREKLRFIRTRLEATRIRGDGAYPDAAAYLEDLQVVDRSLRTCGAGRLADGQLRDAIRRAEVFGFHLASMDLRQHSEIHEAGVAELLEAGGVRGYASLDEPDRVRLLSGLLDRADIGAPRSRAGLSARTRELLATLDAVGRARRDQGPQACERYVISFTSTASDALEVLFLARAARLAPDELRPVPLLEQLEDLEHAEAIVGPMLELGPCRTALGGELEIMIGYSDSGKQAGYVASAAALRRAQTALARVADQAGLMLTIFHGRGGAVGRGGGPSGRAIRAQPACALRGRLRVTEQGETITARYGRFEIACRDLEQTIHAVLLGSLFPSTPSPDERSAQEESLTLAANAAHAVYRDLLSDRDRLAVYAGSATPILHIGEFPIASRPSARRPGLGFEDLRAIPWVFSWNQSRHGLPGWYGLGSAMEALAKTEGRSRPAQLYQSWPFFRALVDNAQLALARADMDVAEHYSRLADPEAAGLFELIRAEHGRTRRWVLETAGASRLLAKWPTLAGAVARRNPFVDVLSHAQIELLRRARATEGAERERIHANLYVTINGIAAGLQTAG